MRSGKAGAPRAPAGPAREGSGRGGKITASLPPRASTRSGFDRRPDARRPAVRTFEALDGIAARLRARALARGHRAVLLLRPAGRSDLRGIDRWVRTRAELAGAARRGGRRGTGARASPDPAHRVQRLLGDESDGVPITLGSTDGWRAASPALLAAALGTVRAGGLVVLVVPRGPAPRSPLVRRLVERLDRDAAAPGAFVAAIDLVPGFGRRARRAPTRPSPPPLPRPAPVPSPAALAEQEGLLARARAALARPRGTVVLLGARGRGKSALAGRLHAVGTSVATPDAASAAAPLATSASRAAIGSLERHAGGPVRFAPPDVALREPSATLFVDEAATLPTAVLGALLARHDRAVLATTVSGHEMAGRAFVQRLTRILGPGRADAAVLEPARAMRWREGDPLERALDRALLLDAMAVRAPAASAARSAGVSPRPDPRPGPGTEVRVARVALARWRADEGGLRALVRLLASAHYQSALGDVEHLLGGALEAYVATRDGPGGDLLGAALVAREGGLDPGLGPDVLAGRRRLPDQLLPQLLARATSDPSALGARYARVVRVAVAPDARRAGVGSALLREIAGRARDEAVDAVGASFAAEPGATGFWLANGYRVFHEGARINPRSGTTSRSVLLALGDGPRRGTNVHEPR